MGRDEREQLLEKQTLPGESIHPPVAPLPLVPGQILLDKYEVERVLGIGGMGIVVSAMHLELGERVAIKAMLPEVAASRDHATRFAREAQAAARIKSEFVARVTDVARLPDGTPFMVMEYLEGETLAAHLERQGALAVDVAVDTLLEACVALAEAHRLGIVHRDVKPANLFLARRPSGGDILKVLDFGISKSDENVTITRTSGAIGTPSYMSPEQLRAAGTVRNTADIWSLGVVLFEMLTHALPYEGATFADICALVLVTPPRSPRSLDPSIPEELEGVILRCLERDQAHRFPSVLELARALAPFASEAGCALVDRIEQIGAARASLVSYDEAPISGRRSFTSLPRITPRSLTPRSFRPAAEAPSPGAIASAGSDAPPSAPSSAPPSSAAPVTQPDPSRTPPAAWRTIPPEEPRAAPSRRSSSWVGVAAVVALGAGVGWLVSSSPGDPMRVAEPSAATPRVAASMDRAALLPVAPLPSAAAAPASASASSATTSATATAPKAAAPKATAPKAAGPGSSAPPAPRSPPASPSKFDDFGGRR